MSKELSPSEQLDALVRQTMFDMAEHVAMQQGQQAFLTEQGEISTSGWVQNSPRNNFGDTLRYVFAGKSKFAQQGRLRRWMSLSRAVEMDLSMHAIYEEKFETWQHYIDSQYFREEPRGRVTDFSRLIFLTEVRYQASTKHKNLIRTGEISLWGIDFVGNTSEMITDKTSFLPLLTETALADEGLQILARISREQEITRLSKTVGAVGLTEAARSIEAFANVGMIPPSSEV